MAFFGTFNVLGGRYWAYWFGFRGDFYNDDSADCGFHFHSELSYGNYDSFGIEIREG